MYETVISSNLYQTYAFVQTYRKDIPTGYNKDIYHIDINKCRKNCIYYSKYKFPVFTVMDQVEMFTGNISQPGLYYVETDIQFPLHGNGWYSQAMINYCIEKHIITNDDLKYVIYASLSIPQNYYNKFIDFLNKNVDDKLCVNTMIGCFKPKIREHWKSLCIDSNANVAFYHYIDKSACFINYWEFNNTTYYEVFNKYNISHEETEAPIYNMVLELEAIELHKMSKLIKSKGGCILDLSTDCITCVFKNKFPFKLDEKNNILNYYYDEDKQFPKYKLEAKDDESQRLKVERLPHYTRKDKYNIENLVWKTIQDVEDNDFKPLIDNIISNKISVNINGRAGTGKSTFINQLVENFDKQGITYKTLAYTNKAARIINGMTIHKFINSMSKKAMHEINYEVLIIDEISMVPEIFYKYFCIIKRFKPNIKFIIAGDFDQCLPVKDRVGICDYKNSCCLYELVDGNRLELTRCRRSDDTLFNMLKPENIGNIKSDDFNNKFTDRHITLTNLMRIKINELMMKKKARIQNT